MMKPLATNLDMGRLDRAPYPKVKQMVSKR